jgi:hypothetical protein
MSDSETILRSAVSSIPTYLSTALDPFNRSVEPVPPDLPSLFPRAGSNLVDRMIAVADRVSVNVLETVRQEIGSNITPQFSTGARTIPIFLNTLLKELNGIASLKPDEVKTKFAEKLEKSALSAQDRTLMQTLRGNVEAAGVKADGAGAAIAVIEDAAKMYMNMEGLLSAARNLHFGAGPRAHTALPDWDGLTALLARAISLYQKENIPVYSLLHVYWLDEGGVFWTAERLADRLHNGVVPSTAALKSVRVQEASLVAQVISSFSRWWRQGLLCDVAERAAQYSALYGYPLHIAGRTGRSRFVDSLTGFSGAFNNALVRALHYYKDRRNTWITADVSSSRLSFAPNSTGSSSF